MQDTRGRAGSGGTWDASGWDQEGQDTYDSVEWVSRQPWCDGNVVMAGASYLGIVQLLGASRNPPHLRAIAPAMTNLVRADGEVPEVASIIGWAAYMAMEWLASAGPIDPAKVAGLTELAVDPEPALRRSPANRLPELDIPSFPFDFDRALVPPEFTCDSVSVPSLSVTGWFDNMSVSTIEGFLRLRTAGRASHRLIVGPWAHEGRLPHYVGERSFTASADAGVVGLHTQHLGFFDEHVKGVASAQPVVRYFLMGADEWREADQWPPAASRPSVLYLGSSGRAGSCGTDGTLRSSPLSVPGPTDWFDHDPDDPVPTRGGRVVSFGRLVPGPLDRSHLEDARLDILCYTSDLLQEDLDVVGPVELRLYATFAPSPSAPASPSAESADFAARLVDVHPDGRALGVAEGIRRVPRSLDSPESMDELSISLGHTAWRFPQGHRIRLEVSGSDFPAYDRNLNPVRQTVHHDAARPTRLVLRTLRGVAAHVPDLRVQLGARSR